MKYTIEVEEVLRRRVEVEAENEDKAVEIVRAKYDACEVVLGADDFFGEASFRRAAEN